MMNLNRALMHVYLIILCASGCSPAFIYVHQPNIAESYFSNKAQKAKRSAEKNPQNPNTLIAACSLMTMYHYGFTMEAADRIIEHNYALGKETFETAHLGFISAYAFGEAALRIKYPEFSEWINGVPSESLDFKTEDVPVLYWTGAALGGAISSSRGDPKWVIRLPIVGKLFESALKINPAWNRGSLYSAMISYTMSRSDLDIEANEIAADYLQKANIASGGFHGGAELSFAETVLVKTQNKEAFMEKVQAVLNNQSKEDVADIIVAERAQWLLSRTGDLFY